jgi:hypothetical protein
MTADEVRQAAERLRDKGEGVSVRKLRAELGYGSLRDISTGLKALGLGELAGEADTGEGDADELPVHAETGLALPEPDAAVDPVQAAEHAVAQAQHALAEVETEGPKLDATLADARRTVFRASQQHLITSYAVSKGVLPTGDPSVMEAEQQLWASGKLLRQVTELHDALPAKRKQAQAGLRLAEIALSQAKQLTWLQAEHPTLARDYAQARAALADFVPEYDKPGESIRAKARLQQRVDLLDERIKALLPAVSVTTGREEHGAIGEL